MTSFRLTLFLCLTLLATTLSSCDAIAGIFKAGAYTGIIAVVIIVLLVFWLLNKLRRR